MISAHTKSKNDFPIFIRERTFFKRNPAHLSVKIHANAVPMILRNPQECSLKSTACTEERYKGRHYYKFFSLAYLPSFLIYWKTVFKYPHLEIASVACSNSWFGGVQTPNLNRISIAYSKKKFPALYSHFIRALFYEFVFELQLGDWIVVIFVVFCFNDCV